MDIVEGKLDNLALISLAGRLDTSSSADLEKKMDAVIESGQMLIIVDLGKVEYISSSGLRVLLASLKKVRRSQGDIRLACLANEIRQVFDTAGFSRLFAIFDTVEAAGTGRGSTAA